MTTSGFVEYNRRISIWKEALGIFWAPDCFLEGGVDICFSLGLIPLHLLRFMAIERTTSIYRWSGFFIYLDLFLHHDLHFRNTCTSESLVQPNANHTTSECQPASRTSYQQRHVDCQIRLGPADTDWEQFPYSIKTPRSFDLA